jgi:hypothetical protein
MDFQALKVKGIAWAAKQQLAFLKNVFRVVTGLSV